MPNTTVLMPKLGQAMTEGSVVLWHRKDGERVEAGAVLVTVETDKATYDLEATASGTVHIIIQEGEEVPIDTVIAEIGDAPVQTASAAPVAPQAVVQHKQTSSKQRVLASPKAKRLAAQRGIDLSTLTPSGADGIISASDVENAVAAPKTPALASGSAVSGRIERERRKLIGMRKASARRVQEAWQTIPHIVQMIDLDATALRAMRKQLKQEAPAITLNDVLLHTAARVLTGLPDLNGTIQNDELVLYDGVDIGFAVGSPRGLLVPVIRRADTLSMAQLVAESQRLIEAGRTGQLGPDDMGNASLTVSNLGMFGIQAGTPVINLGEPILVFVGAVEDRPVVVNGQIVVRPMMTLSIAYDHRIADGVAASRFSQGLKQALENLESEVQSSKPVLSAVEGSKVQSLPPNPQSLTPNPQDRLGKRELHSVSAGERYEVQVHSQNHVWTLDEPNSDGGNDAGPDPVTAFLGALLSCMTIAFKAAARRRKVTIDRIEGHINATPKGHVKEIVLTLEVWSPAAEQDLKILLERAERGCYVSGVLKPEINFAVELTIHSTEAS